MIINSLVERNYFQITTACRLLWTPKTLLALYGKVFQVFVGSEFLNLNGAVDQKFIQKTLKHGTSPNSASR